MRRKQPSQMEQHADKVVLRRWRKGGEVIALFPEELSTLDGLVASYQHAGQHGAADYQHIMSTKDPVPGSKPNQQSDFSICQ